MSTVVVSLAMVVAVVGVMTIVFTDPDQPATLQKVRHRARRAMVGRGPTLDEEDEREPAPAAVYPVRGPELEWIGPEGQGPPASQVVVVREGRWDRLRSGASLVVLLAFVGAIVALALAVAVVVIAFKVRQTFRNGGGT